MNAGKRNRNDRKYPQKPDLRRLVKTTEEKKRISFPLDLESFWLS